MIKLFATAVEALEQIDGAVPANQLALIREWRTGTLLIKAGQFHPFETDAIRDFCRRRSFDLAYYPQMTDSEANRYNQLPEPIYFAAAPSVTVRQSGTILRGLSVPNPSRHRRSSLFLPVLASRHVASTTSYHRKKCDTVH